MSRLTRAATVAMTLHLSAITSATAQAEVPTVDLSRYDGEVVVVAFLASWCSACHGAIPTLNGLQARLGDEGLHVVGVSREDAETIERYRDEAKIAFDLARDPDGALAARHDVRALPTFLLLDRQGQVQGRFVGAGETLRRVEAAVSRLLRSGEDGVTFGRRPRGRAHGVPRSQGTGSDGA